MNLEPPPKVRKLQQALHAKAKGSPDYRFYLLYDKVYREDVLAFAFRRCHANGGAPGVDGQTFHDIASYGREQWLGELAEALRNKTYRPEAVRRVYIPKPDGRQRPLGIPTIRDRVVQTAALLVLEPIFEADLLPEQYAYRSGRGALDAIQRVHGLLSTGHTQVVDADLSGYFDSIPHADLMKSVARRVSDKHMLHLIKMWLEAPVEETDERGCKQRQARRIGIDGVETSEACGTPQGAPLSPLLSNLYMRRFVLAWKTWGCETRLDAHIVNYADDFVICCRRTAAPAAQAMRRIMGRLKLTVNEAKTRICRVPDETFNFLGYTIGRCYSPKNGRAYIGTRPAKDRVARICRAISESTDRKWTWQQTADVIRSLNQRMVGWANYFRLGQASPAYRAIDDHARNRLRHWLRHKYKRTGRCTRQFPDSLLAEWGLVRLTARPRNFSCATA